MQSDSASSWKGLPDKIEISNGTILISVIFNVWIQKERKNKENSER